MPDPGTMKPSQRADRIEAIRWWPPLAAWVPSCLLVAELCLVQIGGWPSGQFNLVEATAMRDAGEVQRQLWRGASATAPQRVRGRVVRRSKDLWLTPMEAAIMIRRADLATLLLANGAVRSAEEGIRLLCLAEQQGAPDIVRLIQHGWENWPGPACSKPVPEPWQVELEPVR
jgi:hypothetical protein